MASDPTAPTLDDVRAWLRVKRDFAVADGDAMDAHFYDLALAALDDAERWRAFVETAQVCTEGPDWSRGGYWLSGEVADEPLGPRDHEPTPTEYGDALVAKTAARREGA